MRTQRVNSQLSGRSTGSGSGGSGGFPDGVPPVSGLCLRLYSQARYESGMAEARGPRVTEENLSHLVLLLKRLDIADMGQCKFLDRPGTACWVWV